MYTATMTADELVEEFTADLPQIIGISDAKQRKADKIIRRAGHFPVYLHSCVRSKRGNEWLILLEAKSRKYVGEDCLMTMVSVIGTGSGRYAMMHALIDRKPVYMLFTPHFFQRFSLRAGVELTGIDLIRRYFKINPSYGLRFDTEVSGDKAVINAYGSTVEGVALGVEVMSENRMILFRTFITYDMCKGEQVEVFARSNEIRKELHEVNTSL